jgi:hypothetical protein
LLCGVWNRRRNGISIAASPTESHWCSVSCLPGLPQAESKTGEETRTQPTPATVGCQFSSYPPPSRFFTPL